MGFATGADGAVRSEAPEPHDDIADLLARELAGERGHGRRWATVFDRVAQKRRARGRQEFLVVERERRGAFLDRRAVALLAVLGEELLTARAVAREWCLGNGHGIRPFRAQERDDRGDVGVGKRPAADRAVRRHGRSRSPHADPLRDEVVASHSSRSGDSRARARCLRCIRCRPLRDRARSTSDRRLRPPSAGSAASRSRGLWVHSTPAPARCANRSCAYNRPVKARAGRCPRLEESGSRASG